MGIRVFSVIIAVVIVTFSIDTSIAVSGRGARTFDFDDIVVGSVVVRGPSWKWGNQDGGISEAGEKPRGVVREIKRWAGELVPGRYAVIVEWDQTNVTNVYRYGAENARDVAIVGRRDAYLLNAAVKMMSANDLASFEGNENVDPSPRPFVPPSSTSIKSRRSALADIWTMSGGESWISNKGWRSADARSDPCTDEWEGVVCNKSTSEIVAIDLSNNNLVGTFPHSITELLSVESLTFANNRLLRGRLPSSGLERLRRLRFFAAHNGDLTGHIPSEFGKLTKLEWLSLYNNRLSGSIPETLGDCHLMQSIFLQMNRLSGTLPDSLGNLKGLRVLSLHHNDLTGAVPRSIAELPLTQFSISATSLRMMGEGGAAFAVSGMGESTSHFSHSSRAVATPGDDAKQELKTDAITSK